MKPIVKFLTNKWFIISLGFFILISLLTLFLTLFEIDFSTIKNQIESVIKLETLLKSFWFTFSVLIIFVTGFFAAKKVAHYHDRLLAKSLGKQCKIKVNIGPIKDGLKKGLIVKGENQDRLSEFEIDSIISLLSKQVNNDINQQLKELTKIKPNIPLTSYLFSFFISGIILLVLVVFLLIHYPPLQPLFLHVFQGPCN